MVTTLSLHQQTIMVSTLNVLLLTLKKALLGGRPRITRFILIPISLQIRLNHASCSLYLSSYALVWMCVMKHIHRPFKSSMVFGLKYPLQSNWTLCEVWLMFWSWYLYRYWLHVWTNPCRKINSNWASHWAEFKCKGKTKFWINIARHTHADAILIQPCLSKYLGEIKF